MQDSNSGLKTLLQFWESGELQTKILIWERYERYLLLALFQSVVLNGLFFIEQNFK